MKSFWLIFAFATGWLCSDMYRRYQQPDSSGGVGSDRSAAASVRDGKPAVLGPALNLPKATLLPNAENALPGKIIPKRRDANIHGLLIISMPRGEAGSASKMSAVALEAPGSGAAQVNFNQEVGESMATALTQVRNFIEVRNNGWPQDWRFDLSFEERYSPKDGPSAAVACALLLNSLVTGKANDPEFAVTGDMNADGTVRPIGGVAAKIRGATQGKCSVVAIPVKNEGTLADMLLTDGPSPFARIQIFSISSFDEAEALATSERSEKVDAALREMKAVQDLLLREPAQMGAWLRNPHVVTKLQTVLSHAPNHLSAKYLLLAGAGKTPRSLSLAGSLDAIEHAASELVSAIKLGGQSADSLRKDVVGSSITRLQNLRARCDPRVQPYADAVIRFGEAVKELQDRPPNTAARGQVMVKAINAAASAADSEMSRLASDPSIREALEK